MFIQNQIDRLARLLQGRRNARKLRGRSEASRTRVREVESMEPRILMAADPIQIGAVYIEEDLGSDLHGDSFHITFQGGAADTQLRRVTIDGDLNSDGFSLGDLFFDTADGGLGADESYGFQVVDLQAAHPNASVSATVVDGSTRLVLDFNNFQAGDKLIFSIDVDEVQFYDPGETDLDVINDNFDPITSGVEFQNSHLIAEFDAPHYEDVDGQSRFRNRYDDWIDTTGLPLPRDDDGGKRDRTAGAGIELIQTPKPISIAGTVYVDVNEDLVLQPTERRLAGVQIELFRLQGGQYVSTGHTVTTNANGQYQFPTSLGLMPGTYQVREAQPTGYYSVGATIGLLQGAPVGQTVANNPDILTEIDIPNGDTHATELNFAENVPSSISGHVCVITTGFDCFDATAEKEPLENVLIELRNEAGQVVATTHTDAQGYYEFLGLRAGNYTVTEVTPPGLLNGGSSAGSAGGFIDSADRISQIFVTGGVAATDYDFCEVIPAEISGHTYYDVDNNGIRDTSEPLLSGVLITLWDDQNNQVAQTTTDANGFYEFVNLHPGHYRLTEVTPLDYLPGLAAAGTVDGQSVGQTDATGDVIDLIVLESGDVGINYDFGEIRVASIAGQVFADTDGDCIVDPGETGIAGVRIELLNSAGVMIATTFTDANGRYRFDDLVPGIYSVREIQPEGYFHGGQRAGTGGGDDSAADLISTIDLSLGGDVINYDFCELPPGSISGEVFADIDFDCVRDPDEIPLSGVRIELLDATGAVVATTFTDADGQYQFDGLRPGEYAVRETQPNGYFHGGQVAPATGGDASVDDLLSAIVVGPAQAVVEANFCEVPPAEISGYVFQDGSVIFNTNGEIPEDLRSIRDGSRTTDDTPIAGVSLELRSLTGSPIDSLRALPGYYSAATIRVQTDSQGFFQFQGLRAGSYHIYETQPTGYEDGIDTPGTTTGFAINPDDAHLVPSSILQLIQFSSPGADPGNDAILSVAVEPGQVSQENNFSEVLAQREPIPPEPPNPPDPPRPTPPVGYYNPPAIPPKPVLQAPVIPATFFIGVGSSTTPTWHLSIINGGYPRGAQSGQSVDDRIVVKAAERLNVNSWTVTGMESSYWQIVSTNGSSMRSSEVAVFDVPGAHPLAGDFDGDGFDELVLFVDGEWFIDFNGNGRWDEADIWLRLGTNGDQPVVGDWDGDGKDDVGIFGHKWDGDDRALAKETGLPDPQNYIRIKPKNVPPSEDEAPNDPRLMKRNSNAIARADLIDHVFQFGGAQDIAISGDFNGDGIANIGTFRAGRWIMDVDGNGRLSNEFDRMEFFGQAGDLPVVGDFDGDGIDEIAIVRGSRVIVDSNSNGQIDATDQVFLLDSDVGTVVVGDFDGDGKDEPALHRSALQRAAAQVKRPAA